MWVFSRVGAVNKRLHTKFTGFMIKFYAFEMLPQISMTQLPSVKTPIANYGAPKVFQKSNELAMQADL